MKFKKEYEPPQQQPHGRIGRDCKRMQIWTEKKIASIRSLKIFITAHSWMRHLIDAQCFTILGNNFRFRLWHAHPYFVHAYSCYIFFSSHREIFICSTIRHYRTIFETHSLRFSSSTICSSLWPGTGTPVWSVFSVSVNGQNKSYHPQAHLFFM